MEDPIEIQGKSYINRERNATRNIEKIGHYMITYRFRPKNYTHDNKIMQLENAYNGKYYEEYKKRIENDKGVVREIFMLEQHPIVQGCKMGLSSNFLYLLTID
jgi:hypothetical protein